MEQTIPTEQEEILHVTYNYEIFLGACNNANVRNKNKYKNLVVTYRISSISTCITRNHKDLSSNIR